MIALAITLVILAGYSVGGYFYLKRIGQEHEDRWQGRLRKCDEILAAADKADQRSHQALVEIARAQDRTQDHLLTMERVLTDPRVHQALR